jgi:hypothetical protein
MLGLLLQVRVIPERRLELIQFVKGLKDSSPHIEVDLQEPLFEDMVERNRVLFILRFQSEAELKAFRQIDRYHSLIGSIKVLGTLEALEHTEPLTDWLATRPPAAPMP